MHQLILNFLNPLSRQEGNPMATKAAPAKGKGNKKPHVRVQAPVTEREPVPPISAKVGSTRIIHRNKVMHVPYKPSPAVLELCTILRHKRPHGSKEEEQFCKDFLDPVEDMKKDGFDNYHLQIDWPDKDCKDKLPLFSCHTDTVHKDGGMQTVLVDENNGEAFIDARGTKGKDAWGSCLGADDGTGVWIMLCMIKRKVPGYYIFHRGEECGGLGSKYIKENWKEIFGDQSFDQAIAFDRKGTNEVICSQGGVICASESYGGSLAAELNRQGFSYKTSPRGSFTDTANYKYLVPECVNLAVGYDKQHGPNETQFLPFAEELMIALCHVKWNKLSIKRDHIGAKNVATYRGTNSGKSYGSYGGWERGFSDGYYDDMYDSNVEAYDLSRKKKQKAKTKGKMTQRELDRANSPEVTSDFLIRLIAKHPLTVLVLLKEMSLTEDDINVALDISTPDMSWMDDIYS